MGGEEVNKSLIDGGDLEKKAEATLTRPHTGPGRADRSGGVLLISQLCLGTGWPGYKLPVTV